jgi:tryptophan-rich sensory protein
VRQAILYSVGLCLVSVALEGLLAGGGIRQRLAELRTPRFAPPFWGWIVIGAFYYLMCFAILYRLFSLPPKSELRNVALGLVIAMMLINALWNWFFFRTRNLFHALLVGVAYTPLALVLFFSLLRADHAAARWLAPYIAYLCYANVWGYQIWKLNQVR